MSARPADQQLTNAARGRDTRKGGEHVSLADNLNNPRPPHPTVADHLEDEVKARLLELAKHVI